MYASAESKTRCRPLCWKLFAELPPCSPGKSRDVRETADDPHDDPVILPIEDHIDLHPFAPRDIPSVVEEYVLQCHEEGLREVRIIHGRGKGGAAPYRAVGPGEESAGRVVP